MNERDAPPARQGQPSPVTTTPSQRLWIALDNAKRRDRNRAVGHGHHLAVAVLADDLQTVLIENTHLPRRSA